jgi:hypothetical protein
MVQRELPQGRLARAHPTLRVRRLGPVDPPDPTRLQISPADVRRATLTTADLARLRIEAEP